MSDRASRLMVYGRKRLPAAAALTGIVLVLDYIFVDFNMASTALEPAFCFAATLLYALKALHIRKREAFYCTVWSYLLTETATQIVMPMADLISGSAHGAILECVYMLCYLCGMLLVLFPVKNFLIWKLETKNHYHVGRQKLLYCFSVMVAYMLLSNYQFFGRGTGNRLQYDHIVPADCRYFVRAVLIYPK